MSIFKDFWNFIQGRTLGGASYTIDSSTFQEFVDTRKLRELSLYEFALNAGINIIANALSMCEVRTFQNWKEVKRGEYYQWNYAPNINQNASEFMHKLVWTLIYRNECLVVSTRKGDMLIADSYQHDQFALKPDTFSNVTVCSTNANGSSHPYTFPQTFRMDDVLFYKLNNANIVDMLNSLVSQYNDLLQSAINKFYKSGGERGILNIDANAATIQYGTKEDGTPRTFNDVYGELMNKQFATYFKSPNAVMTLWKGFSYETKGGEANKKSTSEIKDVTDITDEIYDKVANALQIPAALLRGDVASVSELTRNLITFAVDPIAEMIQTENNRKRSGTSVLNGTYQMIDTSRIMHMDVTDIAASADKMIGAGLWSIDDALKRTGDAPLNTEWSTTHWMTKNYSEMTALTEQENDAPEGSESDDNKAE